MHILVVDDDNSLRLVVKSYLLDRSHQVDEACDGSEAIAKCRQKTYDAVLLDVNMPQVDGIEALEFIKDHTPETTVIMLTAYSDVKDAVKCMKLGAYDYIEKPVDLPSLESMLACADTANNMVAAMAMSAPNVEFAEGREMIGASSPIKKVFNIINKLSKVETSVMIRGESGTGKELVARAIHFNSQRKKGPFVAINCGAIPEDLIESELFGHEKGAFTGADKRKLGKFQFAEGGTLFLDELGDISAKMQVKLLRVLQEKVIVPVGQSAETKIDVRIIAATNKPLEEMIKKGEFRSDLFYRLNVLPIHLPQLKDRVEDIDKLSQYLIKKFNKEHNRSIQGFAPSALEVLKRYDWPGNIRELENVIEHAFIIESSDIIHESSLPENIVGKKAEIQQLNESHSENSKTEEKGNAQASTVNGMVGENRGGQDNLDPNSLPNEEGDGLFDDELNYPQLKEKFEREFIVRALKKYNGRINRTAEHTKMTKVTLLRKLDKFGINAKDYTTS